MTAARRTATTVAACAGLAALSLLLPWALAFDPQVWVAWGQGAFHGDLHTEGGPTWKPLSVLFTTLLAPFDRTAEPLWLIIGRTGALLALVAAYALGARLAGRLAGAVAALVMALSPWWLLHGALGNSEGLLAAAVLGAVLAHLDGRHRMALALGVAAGLLRPEVWPFLGLYVLWLWREEPRRPLAGAIALAVVAVGWLLPDALGTDGLFAAGSTARATASAGSAQLEAVPFLAVLWDAVEQLGVVAAPFAVAALLPWRRASPTLRAFALAGAVYVLIVAVSAQAGFAGNPRYLVPAEALFCVLAGAGVARLGRAAPAAAVVLAVALAITQYGHVHDDLRTIRWRAEQRENLDVAIARAGGLRALQACGNVQSGHFWRALVSSRLDVDIDGLDRPRNPTRVLVRGPAEDGGAYEPARIEPGLTRRVALPDWEIWTACRP
jgi:hypothetical protein